MGTCVVDIRVRGTCVVYIRVRGTCVVDIRVRGTCVVDIRAKGRCVVDIRVRGRCVVDISSFYIKLKSNIIDISRNPSNPWISSSKSKCNFGVGW